MKRRAWAVAILVLIASPVLADNCPQHDEGLDNDLSRNIVTENARTARDHLNGTVNHLFMTNQGAFDWMALHAGLPLGQLLMSFAVPYGDAEFPVVSCNEIGQCGQVTITSSYLPMPSGTATGITNGVLEFFSLGALSFESVKTARYVHIHFSVTLADGSVAQEEWEATELQEMSWNREVLDIESANSPAATDKRCRDNENNLTTEVDSSPFDDSDLDGAFRPSVLTGRGYYIKVQIDWDCRASETGVVCRRVYDWLWIEPSFGSI